jgi:hypothetical protein
VWDLRVTDDDGGIGPLSRRQGGFGAGDGTICIAVSGHGDLFYFDGSFHRVTGGYNLRILHTPPDGNEPPSVVVPDRLVAEPGSQVLIDASDSSDPNGDPLTFRWEQVAGPEIELGEQGEAVLTVNLPAELAEETLFRFSVSVSDGFVSGQGATDVLVRPNTGPTLGPIDDFTVTEGDLIDVQLSATDPEEDGVTFGVANLPERATVDPVTGAFRWQTRFGDRGEYALEFYVEDEFRARDAATVSVVVLEGENLPPVVQAIEPQLVYAERPVTSVELAVVASDPEEQPLAYAWYQVGDDGEPIGDSRGEEATLSLELVPGDYRLVVLVSDGDNEVTVPARVLIVGDEQRPMARLGGGQDVPFPGDAEIPAAFLDGRASYDPLGRELAYEWEPSLGEGEPATYVMAHGDVPGVGVLYYVGDTDAPRSVTVTLTVLALDEDFGEIASEPASATVQLREGAAALPVATIGEAPERLAEGESVQLDGTASTPEGVRFAWALSRGLGEIDDVDASEVTVVLGEPRDPTPIGWTVNLMVRTGRATSAPAVAKIRRRSDPAEDVGDPTADAGADAGPDAGVTVGSDVTAEASQPSQDGCGCQTVAVSLPLWRTLLRR